MPDLISFTPERVLSLSGAPRSGAGYTVQFYLSGTTTPVTVYQDAAATVPHPATVTANGNGVFAAIFAADGAGAIKAVIRDATGATYATIDPVFRSPLSASEAANIGFSPTATIIATNVQDAVAAVDGGLQSLLAALGTAISADTRSVTDANNATDSGFYTLNTPFANGPSANAFRMVATFSDPNNGFQIASLSTVISDALYYRQRSAGTWRAWREVISVPLGSTGQAGQVVVSNGTSMVAGSPGAQSAAISLSGAGPFAFAIPTWASRCEVMLFGASMTDGTDRPIVQISTGGAFVTSGYTSYSSLSGNAATATNGLVIHNLSAANSITAIMSLRKFTGNTWIATHAGSAFTGGDDAVVGSGSIALAGAIDGIRIARSGTTDTFDAGSCAVFWS